MATSPAEEFSSEDEIFFGKITMKEIRARFLPKEKRRALRHANRKKDIEMNGSDASIKIIEIHSEPEMNLQNDWTDPSYRTTSSTKADNDIKTDGENSYLRILPDDSFLRLEKQVDDCSISGDILQNHTSEMKFCFDPPSNKQPMTANENVKQVAKTEQSHSFCKNNRDGLFQLEQDCKPIIQAQDDTPPHKHNPPTEENKNQVTPDVPRHHESSKSERTPLKNNNFLETPVTEVISTEMNGSDASIKIIEIHSEPEMNIQNDWTDSSYGTTSSTKPDNDIKADGENSYLRILPDDSFLRLEKQVDDCSISGDILQNHTSEMKFCFDPPSNKQPMTANENVKQVAKTEQSHSFCKNNRDGLFQLEQDCKPIIQAQDDTPPHKHNPPTEENKNQVTPDVPRRHESSKSERTPIKNNNFLETPVTEVISTPRENANNTDIFKTPKNTLSKQQQASSVTKSLRKVNTYQHVASPVALYIKRSPQASLVHCVNPKPQPISHIPKLIKNPVKNISNKENTPLPRTVYRPPKETIVLTRDRIKISKDQHSNLTASTTVVIKKHAPNEGNLKKEIVFQDDTINESLVSQPDFSIHIENSTLY